MKKFNKETKCQDESIFVPKKTLALNMLYVMVSECYICSRWASVLFSTKLFMYNPLEAVY